MDNLRGAALMTIAMLGFAFEDMIIKLMAGAMPTWHMRFLDEASGHAPGTMIVLRHAGSVPTARFSPDGRWFVKTRGDRRATGIWRIDGQKVCRDQTENSPDRQSRPTRSRFD